MKTSGFVFFRNSLIKTEEGCNSKCHTRNQINEL